MIQEKYNQRYSHAGPSPWDDPRIPRLPAPEENGVASSWEKTRATLESTIGRHPGVACGVAVLAGIVLGWWIKRR